MEDMQLIGLFWARDEAAIRETDRKYGRYCFKISVNIVTSPEDAEECVSDTWLRAWDTMPPERPRSLRAYLGRIVRNLSISLYRRRHAQKRYTGIETLLSELDDCVPAYGQTEQAAEARRITEAINSWLDTLEPRDRALFVRRYWYGDAARDLARAAGMTQGQLSGKLYRLRERLRLHLEQEGISL